LSVKSSNSEVKPLSMQMT